MSSVRPEKRVLGGGPFTSTDLPFGSVARLVSYPYPDGTGWIARADATELTFNQLWLLQVYAICAIAED